MDWSTLSELGQGGFEAVPPERLGDLAAWCQDWCAATGEGRYCILAQVFGMIDDWWGEQGVPEALLRKVERAVTSTLPAVLESDASSGALFAVGLRDEVAPLLLPPSTWVEKGYAEGPSGA